MANSQFEYVKNFERESCLLPETYIVVRVDGRGFHRLSQHYNFKKPNDPRALACMTDAAVAVFKHVQDILIGYGDSDEYSFVFDKSTNLFDRREYKLVSTVVSTFTTHYVVNWNRHFPDRPLDAAVLPTFDGRAVSYPSLRTIRDYLSWRQVDCHINNLYNTTFWALVEKGGLTPKEAEQTLCGTLSADKNEILFSRFGINYNNEPAQYRKGTTLRWKTLVTNSGAGTGITARQLERLKKKLRKAEVEILHCDNIKDNWMDSIL